MSEPLRGSGRPPLTPDAALLVNAIRALLEAANGMHSAEQREYGEILPCGKGQPCHVCEVIARAQIALSSFVEGREP
jgi:hypothetical protein